MPRRRKLHILRFAFRGKSSVVPLLLLSPPNPLRWALAGAPVPKPPFGFWLLIRGFGGETCGLFYVFARVQLTRFRPVASSQTPYPSFCLSGQKLSRSAAPPFPTKPTYVGLWRGPHFALLPRTLLYCSNCGEIVGTERITSLICSRKSGGSISFAIFLGTAARRGKGISGAPKPT